MNRAWYLFYGRKLGMSAQEVMDTTYGEMLDMISCLSIYNGGAEEKPPKLTWSEAMRLK